jgi:type I restriction enzyme S subunit
MNSGELNLKRVSEVENRITELGFNNSSTKLLPKKCVLIGLAGQGKTRGTVAINLVELCTNQSIAAILPNPKTFDSEFLYHNLDRRYFELRTLSTGDGGRGGLNLQIIKSLDIELPTVEEQKRISDFITCIDKKIYQVVTQVEKAEVWKKGLMQKMFC